MKKYSHPASEESIRKAMKSLLENGIGVFLAKDRNEAKEKILSLIPRHSEIMTMTSVTLAHMEVDKLMDKTEDYRSIRNQLSNKNLSKMEKQRIGSVHEWVIGSVHAVTEDGKVVIASATGSQLPSYAYGATNVLWVVGTQKIVKDLDEAMDRIYTYVLPLENERAMNAYGIGSGVNKILIVNNEVKIGRIQMILVNESIGF